MVSYRGRNRLWTSGVRSQQNTYVENTSADYLRDNKMDLRRPKEAAVRTENKDSVKSDSKMLEVINGK